MTYTIHDWMIQELRLEGGRLLLYALVYSYSRKGGGCYFGTIDFASSMTGIARRQTIKNLASLVEDGYLLKSDGFHAGRPTIDYVAVSISELRREHFDGAQNAPRGVHLMHGGGALSAPAIPILSHNKDDNAYSSYEEHKQSRACAGEDEAPMVFVEEGGVAVKMTASEHDKLVEEYGAEDAAGAIAYLSLYKGEKPYKTKSDYLAIRRWVIDAYRERKARKGTAPASSPLPSYEEERRAQKERSSERLRAANERLREAGIL